MSDKRKLLLAAIVFTALYFKVTGGKLLEVAPDVADHVVDYMYNGCRDQAMEKFIHSGLLTQELQRSKEFQDAWSANTQCSKMVPNGTKNHTAALLAYAEGGKFIETFNNEVEKLGGNVSTYEENFHFKSLHFLLMDAITLLNPDPECRTLYLLSDKENSHEHVKNGSKVRFAGFTTVHPDYNLVTGEYDLDDEVIFNITSCFFANLRNNTCKSHDDGILLSPAELFTVENIKKKTGQDNTEYTEIVLKHSELDRSRNCHIFSRSPADVSAQWPVFVFVALSLFSLTVE